MTNKTLHILHDAIDSYVEQVDDLADRFNGSEGIAGYFRLGR